jgi:hypothetical protein
MVVGEVALDEEVDRSGCRVGEFWLIKLLTEQTGEGREKGKGGGRCVKGDAQSINHITSAWSRLRRFAFIVVVIVRAAITTTRQQVKKPDSRRPVSYSFAT